jgi:Protein of unknown function (DUF3267).
MKEKTIGGSYVNILNIVFTAVIFVIFVVPFFFVVPINHKDVFVGYSLLWFFLALFLGIICHEGIHGVVFARCAKKGFKSVKFGVNWKNLIPYCHCKEYIQVKDYRLVLLMPSIVLGAIPIIISYIIGNAIVLVFGSVMLTGGAGDFVIYWMLRKLDKHDMVLDHPEKIGYYYSESAIEDSDIELQMSSNQSGQINDLEVKNKDSGFPKSLIVICVIMLFLGALSAYIAKKYDML